MDPNLRTLSLSSWMSLPGLDFETWLNSYDRREHTIPNNCTTIEPWPVDRIQSKLKRSTKSGQRKPADAKRPTKKTVEAKLRADNTVGTEIVQTPLPRRVLSVRRQESREVQTRALAKMVAEYYESYVEAMNLLRFFHKDTFVTSVKPYTNATNRKVRWLVKGVQSNGLPFAYQCRSVVLANGASDLANRLGVSGEDSNDWVAHDLPAMISALERVPDTRRTGQLLSGTFYSGEALTDANACMCSTLFRIECGAGGGRWTERSRCGDNVPGIGHKCDTRLSESVRWTR